MGKFVILLFLLSISLYAELEDHFKRVGDKSGFHQMRNIDFIYMINLDQRPEKFESCRKQLDPFGIHPCRFSAVNGWELSLETINAIGVIYEPWMTSGRWGTTYLFDGGGAPYHEGVHVEGRTYFSHCMSPGAIGIVLSHLSILQDAYDSGYETIWVMEDDIQVDRDPHEISLLIDRLDALLGKEGWDILFTDQDTKNRSGEYVAASGYAWRPNYRPADTGRFYVRRDISPEFRSIGTRFGAYSMILRRSGMAKLLGFFKQYRIFLPYDIDYSLPPDMRLYSLIDGLVSTQPNAPTDNGGPNYQNRM